jgi:hypothetical protein
MPETRRRVAGFTATIGSDEIAVILGYEIAQEISEEEVSGLADTVGDPPIISEQYLAQSVGKTAALNGIAVVDDDGQNAVETAAGTGAVVTLEYRYDDESGYDLQGFFTNFTRTGDKGEATEKFSANFRVNTKTAVSGS